jgi:ABC-2 type transport system ATP-binding protein
MLRVEHLTVRFGRYTAVDDISFRVPAGEIFGFLGPNGAGKTTTIKALTGQIRPSAGKVFFRDRDLWGQFDELKSGFGYVADFDNHLEELTARQNLDLFRRLYGAPPERVLDVLETVELVQEKDQKVRNYSKGMKKKLTIAREILHDPDLLYLDEPTANLDVHSTSIIRNLLKQLAGKGTAVFCTTHNMEEAEEICDRIAVLDQGMILELETPEKFIRRYADPVLRVVLDQGEGQHTRWLKMDTPGEMQYLADRIRDGSVVSIQSHSASFKDVFLKLTGRAFH